MWDSSTGAYLTSLLGHTSSVTSLAFSYDGDVVVSGDESGVFVFGTQSTAALAWRCAMTLYRKMVVCTRWSSHQMESGCAQDQRPGESGSGQPISEGIIFGSS